MISIEDAADTVLPELLLDKEPGYDGWLFEKVMRTMGRVDAGETELVGHDDAMKRLRERVIHRLPYIAFVRVLTDEIQVLNIVHTVRKFP